MFSFHQQKLNFEHMSNVPSVQPFNPWANKKRPLASSAEDNDALSHAIVKLQYIGIDGHRHSLEAPVAELKEHKARTCCLMCLPCFVGGCNAENQRQYRQCTVSLTFVLAAIQVVLFITSLAVGGGFASTKINPLLGPCPRALLLLGGVNAPLIVKQYELYRLIAPLFLHAGVIHIFMNLFGELRFGLFIERRVGVWRVALIYVLGTVGGCLLSAVMTNPFVSVGASSALMGLTGAHLSEIVCLWHKTNALERRMSLVQVLVSIVITLALSALPFVDFGAHFGGLLTGVLLGAALFVSESRLPRPKLWIGASLFLLLAYFVAMFLTLFLQEDVGNAPTQAQLDACG
jgi:membrane associated rhomboid family serine protease